MTLQIQAANIRHAHGGKQIFEDVSFEIKTGDRLALIGANGAGKRTLFRIMAQTVKPDGGAVTWQRGLRVEFLTQESSADPEMTVHELVALAAGDEAALEQHLAVLEARMAEALSDDELTAVMDDYTSTLARLESGQRGESDAE